MARCNRIGSDCWLSEVAWVIKISNCCEWHWYRPRYRNIIVLPLCLSPHALTLYYALLMSFITCNYGAWNYSWQFYNRSPELWMIQFCVNNSYGHPLWLYMVLSTNRKYSFCFNFFFWVVRNRCQIHTRDSTIAIDISDGQFLRLPTNFFGIGQDIYNFVTFHSGSNFMKKLLTFFSFAYETELHHNVDLYRLHTLKYLINEYLV